MKHAPGFCDHCGLPLGRGALSAAAGRFCCYGCLVVNRIVGQGGDGVADWIFIRFGIGTALAMTVMMISLLFYSEPVLGDLGAEARGIFTWIMVGVATPAFLLLGLPFVWGALAELRRGRVSSDTLIALGVAAAYGVSLHHTVNGGPLYFDTATMLLVFLTLGRWLEASAKTRASRLLRGLMDLAAPTARLVTPEGEREVPVAAVRPGDQVRVRPGERVPVDGRVISGRTTVEEALFTGESLPVVREVGERVYGGSVSVDGLIDLLAEGVGEASLLGQMVRLVEEAQARRAPLERLVDILSRWFLPVVLLTAATAAAFWTSRGEPERGALSALSVLVVACPCSLGLATPLVHALALGAAARQGVLVRSGEALHRLANAGRVFLDKTGTLTRGRLRLAEITPLDATPPAESLAWLAGLEQGSEHPVARAVIEAARAAGVEPGRVESLRAWPGEGVSGLVRRGDLPREIVAGTAAFLADRGVPAPPPAGAGTPVVVAWDGVARAILTFSDTPRPEAAEALAGLAALGLPVTVLSGDRREAVAELAAALGLADLRAECTPDAKVAAVRAARAAGEVVAMVGDGLNDSPALAEADVGVAMSGGTDLAREAGEVTLVGDDLRRLPWVIALARETQRRVRTNLAWAFGYNILVLAVAFSGRLHPLLAALFMVGSSFIVLANSLGVLGAGEPWQPADSAAAARDGERAGALQ